MTSFRVLLTLMFFILFFYTAIVAWQDGVGLIAVFFGDIAKLGWPGQFNLDFMVLLILSGFWVAWRSRFSPSGIALGITASVLGGLFLSVYLLWLSYRAKGDANKILLGSRSNH